MCVCVCVCVCACVRVCVRACVSVCPICIHDIGEGYYQLSLIFQSYFVFC